MQVQRVGLFVDTGWSKATDTNNISLTNLKGAKNGLTQWFLESFYAAVLVFWCFEMTRWKKICCAKLVWWLHLRSAPHIKPHQITTLNVWRYTVVSIVADAVWGCLGESEGESWCIWVVFWYVKAALGVFGGYLGVQSRQDWAVLKQTHHFWYNTEMQDFFHLSILRYQNTKTAA